MGLFTDLFSSAPAEEAARQKALGYSNANTAANNAIDSGMSAARGLYGKALVPFQELATSYEKNRSAYDDATGVNGADGLARAKATFTASPGYSGGLTTGTDQLMRTAAARGDLGGGNTSADIIKFASDYDAQKYGDYVKSLLPGFGADVGASTTGATGQSSVYGTQASSELGAAGQKANYGWKSAVGTGEANAEAAMAPYNASQNFWNGLLGVANLGLKATGIGGFGK